jgi:hypothetical protein
MIDEVSIWPRALSAAKVHAAFTELASRAEQENVRRAAAAKALAKRLKDLGRNVRHPMGVSWKPVVVETFDHPALAPRWLTLRGKWAVRNGVLHCDAVSFLALARPVHAPVRIEFDARSKHPGDMTAFWGSRENAYKDGYFIGFASNGNTLNKLLRLGTEVKTTPRPLATPGKWHHVIAQVLPDGRVQLFVDNRIALEWKDPHPVRTADTAGIVAWDRADFDNLVIYTKE